MVILPDGIDVRWKSTQAGMTIENDYLFDPDQGLSKKQVKAIYLKLKEKFAENIVGKIDIINNYILKDSVMERICIPVLKSNKKASIKYID